MRCFRPSRSKPRSSSSPKPNALNRENTGDPRNMIRTVLLQLPRCTAHLMADGEAVELARGRFRLLAVSENGEPLATVVEIAEHLRWPVTKDEPVVKLDATHYLFTLPIKDGDPLSYGVAFPGTSAAELGRLDSFLKENTCFSGVSSKNKEVEWMEFAPRMDDYNGILARAVAGGTGQIVKGIFACSNAYSNQVRKAAEMISLRRPQENQNVVWAAKPHEGDSNISLKRVREVSEMTEKLSKRMVEGVGMVGSQGGARFLFTGPGEVLLASLDAVNRVLDAVEAAERQTFCATSDAATRIVTERLGEATGDVMATAGHWVGTAWNFFKLRKPINPSNYLSSGLHTAATKRR